MRAHAKKLDPYATLGIDKTASQSDVRKAYRRRAKDTHPDAGGKREDFEAVNTAPSEDDLAYLVRRPVEDVRAWLAELEARAVFSRDRRKVIYCRRMVRATKMRAVAHENGKRGGNPNLRKHEAFSNSDNLEKEKEIDTEKEKEPPVVPQGDDEFELTAEQPVAPDDVQVAFDEWNALAARIGLPTARTLSDDRRRAIKGRLKVGGLDLWRDALKAVEASAFLRGQRTGSNGQPFKADLAFVCQAKSFSRLVDGGYGQDARAGLERGEDDYVRRQLEALL